MSDTDADTAQGRRRLQEVQDTDTDTAKERRRLQLRASKAKFRSDPIKRAEEISKETDRQRIGRKNDSDKAVQRRQVDSERKRKDFQNKECFSIWCVKCQNFYSNSLLTYGPKSLARSRWHIAKIKTMLDTENVPDCPQCMSPAEFCEEKQLVYTRRNETVWGEALSQKNKDRGWDLKTFKENFIKELDVDHEGIARARIESEGITGAAIVRKPSSSFPISRGDKWISAITADLAAADEEH
jgi:hypothetical protein